MSNAQYKQSRPSPRQKRLALQKYLMSTGARVGLLAVALTLIAAYVVQLSIVSTTGFDISSLERTVKEKERTTQRLELHIAKYRSMKSIQSRLARLDMVQADAVDYVVVADLHVAQK